MIITKYHFLLCIGLFLFFSACENDLQVIDNYRETTVIYGLLNAYDSVQYIRVEKAFLGEGNALLMAQHSDSLYYDTADIEVRLMKYKNSIVIDSQLLSPTDQFQKDEGLFANYPHILYKSSDGKLLDVNATYKLLFHNKKNNTTVTALTPLVRQLNLNPSLPSSLPDVSSTINFASNDPLKISVVTPVNGKFLSLHIRIDYTDSVIGTSQTQQHSLDYAQDVNVAINSTGGQLFEYQIDGSAFFQYVGRNIKKNSGIYRDALLFNMDFIFTVGAEEFYTYYVVNKPTSSLNDNIPDYTNLSSGKGIFSSRSIRIFPDKKLNDASRDSLINGQFTSGRFN